MKHPVDTVLEFHQIRVGTVFLCKRLLRVIKHTRAQTHSSLVALKDVVIHTALAPMPELFIVS